MEQPEGCESLVEGRNAVIGSCDRLYCSLRCFRAKNQLDKFAALTVHERCLRLVGFSVLEHLRTGPEVATNDVNRGRSVMLSDIVIPLVVARFPGEKNERKRACRCSRGVRPLG